MGAGLNALLTRDSFDRLPIIMTAVHNYEQTRIVDRSFATTNDNKKASFRIVNTSPYITTDVSDGVAVQGVRNAEAVTAIAVTPRVNEGNSVTLELTLTLSDFSGSGTTSLPPGTNTREYTGEAVTVPNNAYVVFGGLETEAERKVEVKVPWLGDLPIFGNLFKSQTHTKTRSRLYIFVRPTIFEDEDFRAETQFASRLLESVHLESGHEPWLPLVQKRDFASAGFSLQDQAIATFGTGSGSPFAESR